MDWNWDVDAISAPPQIPGVTDLQPLGAGGMGQVYQGRDGAGRTVAIKVMRRLDPESMARFQREAELLARFRAPEVVTAHAWGVTDRCCYLICALVEGEPFDQAAARLEGGDRVRLLVRVARAVGVAHRGGVVHRDLKPSNILVTPAGEVRLIDFGISIGLDQERLTQTGDWLGTPLYLAPEALTGADPDPSSDVWSLGALAFELYAGRSPYPTSSVQDLALRSSPPPPLDHVDRALARVIRRALSPDPARRYPDGSAFGDALEAAAERSERPARLAWALALLGISLLSLSALVFFVAVRSRTAETGEAAATTAPTPTATTTAAGDPAGTVSVDWKAPDLSALPVVFEETFARGTLADRWGAAGDVNAELVDREGAVCLRVVSTDSGYVHTRPAVVKLPDLEGVQAISVRLRAPGATHAKPLSVQVVLGGKRMSALLSARARVTPAWQTFRFELKWMFPLFRAYPHHHEIDAVYLRLPGPGELEVRAVQLLGGKRSMQLGELLTLAFPGAKTLRARAARHFTLFTDLDPFEDDELVEVLRLSQSRLRQTLGRFAARQIPLLVFKDRGGFDAFWELISARHGLRARPDPESATAAIINYATAVYAPTSGFKLDCVEEAARTLLARNLRMIIGHDWLFEGVGALERVAASGYDLGAWLARAPRTRVPLKQLLGGRVDDKGRWQAALLVRFLQGEEAPVRLPQLLLRFREAGRIDLEAQLRAAGLDLKRLETAWWDWVRRTFPGFKPTSARKEPPR